MRQLEERPAGVTILQDPTSIAPLSVEQQPKRVLKAHLIRSPARPEVVQCPEDVVMPSRRERESCEDGPHDLSCAVRAVEARFKVAPSRVHRDSSAAYPAASAPSTQPAPTHASNPLTSARSSVRTIRSNSRLGTRLLSSSVRAARAQRPDESRGSAGATGWAMESCAATACSWRPSAPITLRIVSKPGLRSPERAL